MQALKAKGNQRTVEKLIALKKSAQKDSAYRMATRLHAVILNLEGRSPGEVAEILKVNRTNVPAWIRSWNQYGFDGLLEGHRSGRPAGLNQKDKEKLLDIVESGPVAYGLDTGVWTSIIISKVIQNEFNLEYHPGHVMRLHFTKAQRYTPHGRDDMLSQEYFPTDNGILRKFLELLLCALEKPYSAEEKHILTMKPMLNFWMTSQRRFTNAAIAFI